MTWCAAIVVIWMQANPAQPHDRSAVIWKREFQTEAECNVALDKQMTRAHETYGPIRTVKIIGGCSK